MRHLRSYAAFTLLELVLVMAILAMVVALAAPKLQNWGRGAKLRDSADEFITATHAARTHAAASGAICIVAIDRQTQSFSVKQLNGQTTVNVDGEMGRTVSLPEGTSIQAVNLTRAPVDVIRFYPTGRVEPATVTITGEDGSSITIACNAPTEDFAVVDQGRS